MASNRGDWRGAAEWAEKSAAVVPAPETLALLGDARAALGQKDEAGRAYLTIEAIGKLARAQGTVYDRQRALYCLDHGIHLPEALKLARAELSVRKDIYAYDTLAWAALRNGLIAEADSAMRKALSHNTQDALLFYHAGVIARRRRDRAAADAYLSKAAKLNRRYAAKV